jgi:hypothetical protein
MTAQSIPPANVRYSAVLRLSSIPGDMLPDQVSTLRGCALKIIGVEGERLSGFGGSRHPGFCDGQRRQ